MTSALDGEVAVYTTGEECPWAELYPYFVKGTGGKTYPATGGLKPGVGIMWGLLRGIPELISASIAANRPWVYLDHGYFHRGHYAGHYRMTWCDFQQRRTIERPADRWESLNVKVSPWKKGKNVVVCPPSDLVLRMMGMPFWTKDAVKSLKEKTDRPIVIQTKGQPFVKAMQDAHCVVTIASIAAVEAALLGVPVFVSEMSAAAPIGRLDLEVETPLYPEREQWARSLAYGQFTRDEWASGLAWSILKENLC